LGLKPLLKSQSASIHQRESRFMTAAIRTQLAYLALFAIMFTGISCTRTSPSGPASSADSRGAESTVDRVCNITADLLGLKASSVTPASSLADLGADELDFVELTMEIEEEFDVSISDEAINDIVGTDIFHSDDLRKVTMGGLARIVDKQK